MYLRQCARCHDAFRTEGKHSKICFSCTKPTGGVRNKNNITKLERLIRDIKRKV